MFYTQVTQWFLKVSFKTFYTNCKKEFEFEIILFTDILIYKKDEKCKKLKPLIIIFKFLSLR